MASPTVYNGTIYIGCNTGIFYALNETNAAVEWTQMLGYVTKKTCAARGISSTASVAIDPANGKPTVYVAGGDGYLYALDAATGQAHWHIPVGSSLNTAPLVLQTLRQTWLALAAQDGQLQLLDAHSGQQLAAWKLGELRASPVAAQGVLYQASLGDRGIFAFQL